jgi:hypothetical protein
VWWIPERVNCVVSAVGGFVYGVHCRLSRVGGPLYDVPSRGSPVRVACTLWSITRAIYSKIWCDTGPYLAIIRVSERSPQQATVMVCDRCQHLDIIIVCERSP